MTVFLGVGASIFFFVPGFRFSEAWVFDVLFRKVSTGIFLSF